jgi:hypothetical protein
MVLTAVGIGFSGPMAMAAITMMGIVPPPAVSLLASLGSISASGSLAMMVRRGKPRFFLRDGDGRLLRLTNQDARLAVLVPGDDGSWRLELSHDVPVGGKSRRSSTRVSVRGDAALRALSRLMPFLNWGIGSKRELAGAVDAIAESRSTDQLVRLAAGDVTQLKTHFKTHSGEANVSVLPPRLRLALEMALHDDDERRAMDGELAELESRWREADALAKIADNLLLPENVEREIREIRAKL